MVVFRWVPVYSCLLILPFLALPVSAQNFFEAAKWGHLDRVISMVNAEPELLDAGDGQGYSALWWAGIRGRGEVARFLIEAGAEPNFVGADGGTALHGAAHHDDVDLMAALLKAGGDVNVRNQWGRTPLHVAARRGCLEVAKLLLDAGADPNAVTHEGWSTLNVAYRGGHPELVGLLLARGADPTLADKEGRLPGEISFSRPKAISLSRRQTDQYVGRYDLGSAFGFDIWREGDRVRLMEFSPDDLLPVAPDTFFCAQEPWTVVFHRDDQGRVASVEVAFIRRTVTAQKVVDDSRGYTYVGSQACFGCHSRGPGNGPAGHWIASRHSRSFHTLTTAEARGLAEAREDYQDITDPSREQRCLMCHVTAALNPQAVFADPILYQEGASCEACHGPGSAYVTPEIMADRASFLANGGRIPNELTCRQCHRNAEFRFLAMWERIRH